MIERAEECRLDRYYEHNGSGLDSDPDDDDERDNMSSWVSSFELHSILLIYHLTINIACVILYAFNCFDLLVLD